MGGDAYTMQFKLVRQVLVGVHTVSNPTRQEWDQQCVLIENTRNEVRAVLIYTDGGGPSSSQRKQMRNALHDTPAPPTAILTESPWVRGIITSVKWFLSGPIAAFEPADLNGALDHLRLPFDPSERSAIVNTLTALAGELRVTLPQYDPISLRAPRRERNSQS